MGFPSLRAWWPSTKVRHPHKQALHQHSHWIFSLSVFLFSGLYLLPTVRTASTAATAVLLTCTQTLQKRLHLPLCKYNENLRRDMVHEEALIGSTLRKHWHPHCHTMIPDPVIRALGEGLFLSAVNCIKLWDIEELVLTQNPLLPSGYTRDTSFLEMVVDIVQELKRANPNLVYGVYPSLCHPYVCVFCTSVQIDRVGFDHWWSQVQDTCMGYC